MLKLNPWLNRHSCNNYQQLNNSCSFPMILNRVNTGMNALFTDRWHFQRPVMVDRVFTCSTRSLRHTPPNMWRALHETHVTLVILEHTFSFASNYKHNFGPNCATMMATFRQWALCITGGATAGLIFVPSSVECYPSLVPTLERKNDTSCTLCYVDTKEGKYCAFNWFSTACFLVRNCMGVVSPDCRELTDFRPPGWNKKEISYL